MSRVAFGADGRGGNDKLTFGEGLAFIALMLSTSAMDSENMAFPAAVSLVSALVLLRSAIKREKENPHTDR